MATEILPERDDSEPAFVAVLERNAEVEARTPEGERVYRCPECGWWYPYVSTDAGERCSNCNGWPLAVVAEHDAGGSDA